MRKEETIMKALAYFDQVRTIRKTIDLVEMQLMRPTHSARKRPLPDEAEALRLSLLRERLELCHRQLAEIEQAIREYLPRDRQFQHCRDRYQLADEQLYLDCRYIQGMTIEETAEAMAISRDTAYRIRRRIALKELDPKTHRLRLDSILNG